ncbi:hypothetical protein BJ741DRAFT_612834 [Chytriomyces cf. hyalinus JEL632]|nr:hypothetical protein BJ741DRAFT_612834 [Chytriomyces cf. hyalinus JEL632]
MQLLRGLSTKRAPTAQESNIPANTGPSTLARMATMTSNLGLKSNLIGRRPSAEELPVFELSATGKPLSAPTSVVTPLPIDYTLRLSSNLHVNANSLDREGSSNVAPLKEAQPKQSAFNQSKAAQTTTLKWWQAPGVTKETAASIAAAAEPQQGSSSEQFNSLSRNNTSGSLPRNISLKRGPNSNSNGRPGPPKLGFGDFDEVALIKANNTEAAAAKGPQFGFVPKLVDRCGVGATVQVIHNFTASSPNDMSCSQDDTVRILRVDAGGWALVKLVKQGTNAASERAGAHRAGVSSRAGMEGLVPVGVLDIMRSKRVVGAGSVQETSSSVDNRAISSGTSGFAARSATIGGPRPMVTRTGSESDNFSPMAGNRMNRSGPAAQGGSGWQPSQQRATSNS